MIGDGASDFAGVLENHVGSIDANSADLLRDFEKFVQLYSAKIKNEQGVFEKNVMNSLSGVSNQIKTQASNEEKYRARQEKAAKDQEIKATKSEKTRDTFLDKAGQAAAKANAQRAEQTKLQKAEAIASELFRSKLVQYVGKIIDQQYEMLNRFAKSQGLSAEQARARQKEIANIVAEMNKSSGGFMYSSKSAMEVVTEMAKQGIDASFQKIALPAALRQKELFGSVGGDFIKFVEVTQQRYSDVTREQFEKMASARQGMMAAMAKELDIAPETLAGKVADAAFGSDVLKNLRAAGKTFEESSKAMDSLTAVRAAAEKQGLGSAAKSLSDFYIKALGDTTERGDIQLAQLTRALKGTQYETIQSLRGAREEEYGKIIQLAIRNIGADRRLWDRGGLASEFGLMTDSVAKELGQVFSDEKNITAFMGRTNKLLAIATASDEEKVKSLKNLENRLGSLQTPLEKIAIWCEEWLAQKGVAGWLLGKGSFSTIAGVVTGVLGVIGGKRATEWIKTLFKGGGEGAGAGGGLSGFFAKGGRTVEEAQAIARSGARAGRIVKIGGTALAAGMAGYNLLQYGEAKTEAEKTRLATQTVGLAGGLGGASLGATLGGSIGTAVGPIGTAIGTLLGSVIGGFLGDELMQSIAGPFVEEMKPFFKEASKWLQDIKKTVSEFWNVTAKPIVSTVWTDFKISLTAVKDGLVYVVGELLGFVPAMFRLVSAFKKGALSSGNIGEAWSNVKKYVGEEWDEYTGRFSERRKTASAAFKNDIASQSPTPALNGLGYVPKDNFPAYLHEGEMVLTRDEANAYRSLWSKSKKYEDGNDNVGGSSNIYSASDRMNMYNSWAFDVFSDMVSTMKGGKLNWGKVKKEDLAPGFLDVFQSAFNSQGTKQWMHQQGIDGIVIISGKRDLNKQAVLAGKGYGSKTSAHLVGKALDFNFLRGNETIKAFVGNRDADIVDPMSLSLYEGFAQAMSDASGGRLRSGAFFKHKDPNHVEMSITPGERSAIEAQAKRLQDEMLMRRAIAAQSEAELAKLKNDPSYYSNMKKTFRDAIVEAYEAGDIQRRMLELSRGEISGPGSVENYGV